MRMELTFENLVDAFEKADVNRHFFIDAEEKEIIYIDEMNDSNASEKAALCETESHIRMPERLPEDEISLIDTFSLELDSFAATDEIQQILKRKKDFGEFKYFLNMHPNIKEKWFCYREKEIRNQAINWLCEAGIEPDGLQLKPDIKITPLHEKSQDKLPEGLKDFSPAICLDCGSEERFEVRLFLLSTAIENALIDKEVKRIMKEKHRIEEYGIFSDGKEEVLTSAKCRACGSENIMWDY